MDQKTGVCCGVDMSESGFFPNGSRTCFAFVKRKDRTLSRAKTRKDETRAARAIRASWRTVQKRIPSRAAKKEALLPHQARAGLGASR